MTTTIEAPSLQYLFTADEFERMANLGIFGENRRVELIEGVIYRMAAHNSPRFSCVLFLNTRLNLLLGPRAAVSMQGPIHVSDRSETEPDIAVLRVRDDDYRFALPAISDIFFIIEVADTSFAHDRDTKMDLYARAGIGESWIVALPLDRVIVYRDPSPDGYRTMNIFVRGDTVSPLSFPDVKLAVADILGPEPAKS